MFSRSFTSFTKNKRLFSCSYNYDKPMFSPFFSSLLWGTIFSGITVLNINGNTLYVIKKLDDLEKEMKEKDIKIKNKIK